MSIKSYLTELEKVNTEIKRLQLNIRELRKRANELSENTLNYLKEKEQVGVKYNGNAVIIENKNKREGKKLKEREKDAIQILEEQGITDAKKILDEILEARKGEIIEVQKIKIKKIKEDY